jgi:1-deoxyxylulose-5-phosphate synthase
VKYRRLGSSDLHVSEISLGSWLTYGGRVAEAQTRLCVDKAFEVGINFIDTANVYAHGKAEEFLGDVLKGRERGSYVLATKLYFEMPGGDRGLSREQVHKQIDASLRRLQTEYVDLYQCHRYDEKTPLEETMDALSEVVRAGKARYLGFSEWSAEQIQASLDVPGVEKFVSSQPQYSLLWREPERDVFRVCAQNGISQIVWSPLAQGVLTGKYRPGHAPPEGSRGASAEMNGSGMRRFFRDGTLEAVQRLRPIADALGLSIAQLSLAWVLRDPNVASAIVGATRPEQVEANAAASGAKLTEGTLEAIEDALSGAVTA